VLQRLGDVSRKEWLMVVMTALLLCLSFPDFNLAPLSWVSLIPLMIVIHKRTPAQSFLLGWISGSLGYLGILYWVNIVMTTYGHLPLPVSFTLHLFLSLYLGLYVGVSMWLVRRADQRDISPALSLPLVWVAGEYVRSFALTGFPWAMLGYSQFRILPVIQIADITGVYGVSFLIVMTNAVGFLIIRGVLSGGHDRYPLKSASILALLLFLTVLYGLERLDDIDEGSVMRVVLVQGNIPQDVKWDPDFKEATVRVYERLTTEGVVHGTDLVVWPESALPTFYQDDGVYGDRLRRLCRDLETSLLFGSPAYERKGGKNRFLNSAFLINEKGEDIGRSDKVHLVPFGEYVPLAPLFPFIQKLVVGIGDFVPGTEIRPLHHPRGDVGVLVCFEGIFPEIARSQVVAGARLLVNITNDAWFGRSSAPLQHLSMTVFRAIETRTPVARAANTGITAFITSKGEVEQATPLFTEAAIRSDMRLGSGVRTIYTKTGDALAKLVLLVVIGGVGYDVVAGRRGSSFRLPERRRQVRRGV